MENPQSLTSFGLRDSLIQTQILTPSQSAGPLCNTGEETQIRETVSEMNHSAKAVCVKEKKTLKSSESMKGPNLGVCILNYLFHNST